MEGMTARMMKDFHKSGMKGNKMEPPKEEEEIQDNDSSNPFGRVNVEIQTEAVPTPQVNAPKVYTGSGGYTYQVNPDSTIEILSAPKAEQQGLVVKPTGRNARAYASIAQEIMGQDEAIASILQPMVDQAKKAAAAPASPSSVRPAPSRPAGAVGNVVENEKAASVQYPDAASGPTAFVLKPPPSLVEGTKPPPSLVEGTKPPPSSIPGDPILQAIDARNTPSEDAVRLNTAAEMAAQATSNRILQDQIDAEKAARMATGFSVATGKYAGTQLPPGSREQWERIANTASYDRIMRNYKEAVAAGASMEAAWQTAIRAGSPPAIPSH